MPLSDFWMWLLVALFVAVMAGLGVLIYQDAHAEKFSLRKDSWTCTKSHDSIVTNFIYVAKVMVPQVTVSTICDQWTAKP